MVGWRAAKENRPLPDSHEFSDPDETDEARRRRLNAMIEKGLDEIRQGRIVTVTDVEQRISELLARHRAKPGP